MLVNIPDRYDAFGKMWTSICTLVQVI